jgi:hypothetical protein
MRLTVGPLPPAVYWRRRLAVLGILLLLVILVVYACSDGGDQGKNGAKNGGTSGGTQSGSQPAHQGRTPTKSPTPNPSGPASVAPLLPPLGSIAPEGGDPVDQGAAGGPGTEPSPGAAPGTGPCTDDEMAVTAVPEAPSVARGTFVRLTLKIKNISNRTCTRDVGADAQELFLLDGAKAKMWSSDACDAAHGGDVRTFRPGIEAPFFVLWDGRATSSGCANRPLPPAGRYQLIGRLSSKLGAPAPLDVK